MQEMTEYRSVPSAEITKEVLANINVAQGAKENKAALLTLGGIEGLARSLNVNLLSGLTAEQVAHQRTKFGDNLFPESPLDSYLTLLLRALSDTTLLILLAAASVSFVIGIVEEGAAKGWIEGGAIFIAILLVSNISAANDYSKQLQFRALEATSQADERCSVLRSGIIDRINPTELVIGDVIILQAGDQIPADAVVFDNNTVFVNEASLTGEPEDLKKTKVGDCFLFIHSHHRRRGDSCHGDWCGLRLSMGQDQSQPGDRVCQHPFAR